MQAGIIDYGAGNMYSIICGLRRAGIKPFVVKQPRELDTRDIVVIPGVGNFSEASERMSRFKSKLCSVVQEGRFILGICLGMHLFFNESEEGGKEGLGFIEGKVIRLPSEVRVPHMGWNTINKLIDLPLLEGLPDKTHFYFAHSYHVVPTEDSVIAATTDYGSTFTSIIVKDSLIGLQFHPEKSGECGAIVLKNLAEMLRR